MNQVIEVSPRQIAINATGQVPASAVREHSDVFDLSFFEPLGVFHLVIYCFVSTKYH